MTVAAGPANGERRLTIAEALREAIAEEMRHDEKVFLIGETSAFPEVSEVRSACTLG